jgi:CelD/BcsL family acetyltransferase involved in cellulose biosynthesis
MERRGRKLAREHDVEVSAVTEPQRPDRELDEGAALEATGWKGQAGTAMLSSPQTAAFYREVTSSFHADGELRFSTLRVDGQLAAFDVALLHGLRYYLLKTTYDESLRRLAPGLALRRAVIERCFELELDAHEFLGGSESWKLLFATGERVHHAWRAYPGRPGPVLRYAYRRHARPRLKLAYLRAKRRA